MRLIVMKAACYTNDHLLMMVAEQAKRVMNLANAYCSRMSSNRSIGGVRLRNKEYNGIASLLYLYDLSRNFRYFITVTCKRIE